jgi:4-amino-4-deoxy-L-arabinose transferase-like glycosyltransferase
MTTDASRRVTGVFDYLLRHRVLFFMLTGLIVYVAFLGLRDVWYPDEPDIAEVTRSMFLSGDWVSPRRMGEIWVDYPPMVYWIGVVSSHILGEMSAFSLRLPNAIAALFTVWLTSRAATKWFGEKAGFWAGLTLLTFVMFVYEGNSYRPDVTFTLAITAGLFSYEAGSRAAGGLMLRMLAFALFGVAMLAKGPLGLLLPGLILVLWHAIEKDWKRILQLAPLSIVALFVYGAWYFSNAQAMGHGNMFYEFYAQNFERFLTSENRGHGQPWYYYIRNFWLDFAPWSFLFPPALWWLHRTGKLRDRRVQLVLLWFVCFFVFLSLAATKRQLYFLPGSPAVALLLALWLAEVGNKRDSSAPAATGALAVKVYSLALALVLAAVGAVLIWAVPNIESLIEGKDLDKQDLEIAANIGGPLLAFGITLLIAGIAIASIWKVFGSRAALLSIAGSFMTIYVVLLAVVMPELEPTKSYRPQSAWISSQIGEEPRFGMVDPSGTPRRGGFAYYTDTHVDLLEDFDAAASYFESYPNTIIIVRDSVYEAEFQSVGSAESGMQYLRDIQVGSHVYRAIGPFARYGGN